MRRGGKLWVATLANREPELYDEGAPLYFKTRRGAQDYAERETAYRAEWGNPEDRLIVRPAPDDITIRDIVWDAALRRAA